MVNNYFTQLSSQISGLLVLGVQGLFQLLIPRSALVHHVLFLKVKVIRHTFNRTIYSASISHGVPVDFLVLLHKVIGNIINLLLKVPAAKLRRSAILLTATQGYI